MRPPDKDLRLNRDGDNWFPLMSVALVVGAGWYKEILHAASSATSAGEESLSAFLLSSLKSVTIKLSEDGETFFSTTELLEKLNEDDEAPWATWKDKMTAKALGKILNGCQMDRAAY